MNQGSSSHIVVKHSGLKGMCLEHLQERHDPIISRRFLSIPYYTYGACKLA